MLNRRKRRKTLFYKKKTHYKLVIFLAILLVLALSVSFLDGKFYNKHITKIFESASKFVNDKEDTEDTEKKYKIDNDTDIIANSNVTYEGSKYGIEAEKVSEIVKGNLIDDEKYVFLTFDDGPSPNTLKVLRILEEKNVKATFFILGQSLENNKSLEDAVKQCILQGNAIGNHTYSHDFKKIYPQNSVNKTAYLDEFNKTNELLKSILGEDFDTRVTRMPGGYSSRKYYNDPNLKSFNEELLNNNIVSIDWSALNGDAEGKNYSAKELFNYAKKSSEGQRQIVILMHDTYGKEKTVEMLPELIDYYKDNGYEFKTIISKN